MPSKEPEIHSIFRKIFYSLVLLLYHSSVYNSAYPLISGVNVYSVVSVSFEWIKPQIISINPTWGSHRIAAHSAMKTHLLAGKIAIVLESHCLQNLLCTGYFAPKAKNISQFWAIILGKPFHQ